MYRFAVLLAVFLLAQAHDFNVFHSGAGLRCNVWRPERCAEPESVVESVEPAGDYFGPNVCQYNKREMVAVRDYQRDTRCYNNFFGQICHSRCVRSENCTVQEVNSTHYDCCAGFAARSSGRDHGFGYSSVLRHPGYGTLKTKGCPIELMDTVVDCLDYLNVTQFAAAIEGSSLGATLREDGEFTVFAPTDEAIDGAFLPRPALLSHVLDEIVRNSQLRTGAVLFPLKEDTLLHVTDVHSIKRWYYTEETYINGAQVEMGDACLAENGIVHTMKYIIPSSPDSIAEVLANDPQFSIFSSLLDATNISQFLGPGKNKSRTVFAPINDAFDQLPIGAVECLLRPENRRKALKVILNHIAFPTEYTSTLSQRSFIKTFRHRLLVCVINGTIHLTRKSVPLLETDIPARNGVIHSLPEVLLAKKINFEKLCPEEPSGEIPTPIEPIPVDPTTDIPMVDDDPSEDPDIPVEIPA